MLQLSEFVWTLRSLALVVFNNFLLKAFNSDNYLNIIFEAEITLEKPQLKIISFQIEDCRYLMYS